MPPAEERPASGGDPSTAGETEAGVTQPPGEVSSGVCGGVLPSAALGAAPAPSPAHCSCGSGRGASELGTAVVGELGEGRS